MRTVRNGQHVRRVKVPLDHKAYWDTVYPKFRIVGYVEQVVFNRHIGVDRPITLQRPVFRKLYRDRSKYTPHQGARECARRKA